MSSSPTFQSSPLASPSAGPATAFFGGASGGGDGRRKKSRFTYRQLSQLATYSTATPLRIVAHIDLDAFYAQCEMVRLGVAEDQPLAVQQWQGLIAINYPARAFGIGRHCTLTEARKLCPSLRAVHVATWKEGEEHWMYPDQRGEEQSDVSKEMDRHKVSLDPYRLQSRRIFEVIKSCLPKAPLQRVEKASIDEVFLDLSAQVHAELLRRFPSELVSVGVGAAEDGGGEAQPPYDDPNERLPAPPISVLDWKADALVDLHGCEGESALQGAREEGLMTEDDPDWDDIGLLIASEIVRDVRAAIRAQLGYTCSAGVASNKMLSKLGSGHKKPNSQTVVRARAVRAFLSDMKFTKIRMLGGKLGEKIREAFGGVEMVRDLLDVSLAEMRRALGDEGTAVWLYNTLRGIDTSEVNARTQIKSMLSAKSFRPGINTVQQAERWLRVFVADIYTRLVEEGIADPTKGGGGRRPKTVNLHHRHGGQMRSRQCAIPGGGRAPLDQKGLFELAKGLLAQIVAEGRDVWPCANLSLSVGGFEDGVSGNLGIGAFLVKGDEATAVREGAESNNSRKRALSPSRTAALTQDNSGIQRFFSKRQATGAATAASPATTAGQGHRDESAGDVTGKEESKLDMMEDDTATATKHDDYQNGSRTTKSRSRSPHTTLQATPSLSLLALHQRNDEGDEGSESKTPIQSYQQADEEHQRPSSLSLSMPFTCPRADCNHRSGFETSEALQDHSDWHMARDLQDEEERQQRGVTAFARTSVGVSSPSSSSTVSGRGRGRPSGRGAKNDKKKLEHGQSRLRFG